MQQRAARCGPRGASLGASVSELKPACPGGHALVQVAPGVGVGGGLPKLDGAAEGIGGVRGVGWGAGSEGEVVVTAAPPRSPARVERRPCMAWGAGRGAPAQPQHALLTGQGGGAKKRGGGGWRGRRRVAASSRAAGCVNLAASQGLSPCRSSSCRSGTGSGSTWRAAEKKGGDPGEGMRHGSDRLLAGGRRRRRAVAAGNCSPLGPTSPPCCLGGPCLAVLAGWRRAGRAEPAAAARGGFRRPRRLAPRSCRASCSTHWSLPSLRPS